MIEKRRALNEKYDFVHPEKPEINGLLHIMWTGKPSVEGATARTPCFMATRPSTARPVALAPRRAWRNGSQRAV